MKKASEEMNGGIFLWAVGQLLEFSPNHTKNSNECMRNNNRC
jgi:hypothetical protein